MKETKKSTKTEEARHLKRIKKGLSKAPWVLRITEHRDKPAPVMIVKERIPAEQRDDTGDLVAPRSVLRERGLVYGPPQVRCLPRIRTILTRICDKAGIPFELHRHLQGKRITFRGNLPLDEEAGCKLALICKLQERIKEMDRVELLARRVDLFTREEAAYWHSRITSFGDAANRWALAGMKVMLAGQPRDPNVAAMLEDLRRKY